MGSETYKHYKTKIEDTKFYLRTIKNWIDQNKASTDKQIAGVANLMEHQLKELFKLYETE